MSFANRNELVIELAEWLVKEDYWILSEEPIRDIVKYFKFPHLYEREWLFFQDVKCIESQLLLQGLPPITLTDFDRYEVTVSEMDFRAFELRVWLERKSRTTIEMEKFFKAINEDDDMWVEVFGPMWPIGPQPPKDEG